MNASATWLAFWTALMIATIGAYAALVIVVSIGGFQDMLQMFRK